ncbi:MAG: ATP synthase F1 subunit gamma [Puniceicoccales bacterium]|jgi:F-type H+-transporting ATPase subunit gamma|nr:ATP synthase F1 subunit gamma [Puniceicoccales bacterium]
MKGSKEIRQRIHAVANTAKITRAMQLVASSKMKKAQDLAIHSRPYLFHLAELVRCFSQAEKRDIQHPFFEKREVVHRGILLVGTERGLCGAMNTNVFKEIAIAGSHARWMTIGKKAAQYVSRCDGELLASFCVSDRVDFSELRPIYESLSRAYVQKTIDTVEVVFPAFINTLVQIPVERHVLPMSDFQSEFESILQYSKMSKEDFQSDPREMIFEPSVAVLLEQLSQTFFQYHLYQILLEAKASEQSSRMVAMKTATDNAENLLKELSLKYNKVRQSVITNEIVELSMSNTNVAE